MKVINLIPEKINYPKNNPTDYFNSNRIGIKEPLKQDTVSFSAKFVLPKTNGKNAVTDLAHYGVGCFCCGKPVIPRSDYNVMISEGYFKCSVGEMFVRLRPLKKYMGKIEKKVFTILEEMHKKDPDLGLAKLLQKKRVDVEQKLIDKQSKIFGEIYNYVLKHIKNKEKLKEFDEIITTTYDEIYGRLENQAFSRKKFIGSIYKFASNLDEKYTEKYGSGAKALEAAQKYRDKHREKLVNIAQKLPTSNDMVDAFIMKYSRKSNKEIATRLIDKKVGGIEHIWAKAHGGPDRVGNFVQECGECNWERGDMKLDKFIREKRPYMPKYSQEYIDKTIELVNSGVKTDIRAGDIVEMWQNAYVESDGLINLDISALDSKLVPDEYLEEFINICKYFH